MRIVNMSPVMMESLPTELLQVISEILDIVHPPSLLAFARASKHFYAVASTVLFRTVKVTITDGKHRSQGACELEARLRRDNAFVHVRRIFLVSDHEGLRYPYLSLHACERGHEDDTTLWSRLNDENWFGGWLSSTDSIPDDEWEPVSHLVGQLTGLADLFWVCPERLLMCLLMMLHERLRHCRLHFSTLHIRSLTESSLNSYERTLIADPSLYSFGNLTALKLVRILESPEISRVYFWWTRRDAEVEAAGHDTRNHIPIPRELIQVDGQSIDGPIPFDVVYKEAAGDLSGLHALKLYAPLAPQGLPAPTDLPSLATLTFTCALAADITSPQYWDEVTTLLRNLPHLTTLQIRSWTREISFIPCLSPNLRRLDLGTTLYPDNARLRDDHIHKLAKICPNLEHLTVEIRRSRGDAAEVARYRSLGRLPRLQELHIYFDAAPPGYIQSVAGGSDGDSTTTRRDTAIEPWFDEQDAEYLPSPIYAYREGHVRDMFVNNAIDASLARSIFQVIDGATPKRSLGRASKLPLERLELRARGEEDFVSRPIIESDVTPLSQFLVALKREWRVERDVRDDARDVLHVRENGQNFSKNFPQIKELNPARNHEYWFNLWRRVWPVEREGVDWWDDWESHPLTLQDDGSVNGG